ncbi:Glycosyltransferase family 61 protein [Trifolium repens]|nr:Glycosyltransferase family 61 protein [Trifolium repens]
MIYNTIFAKSFSRYEQKKFAYGAFVGILLIALSLFTVFKPYLDPIYDYIETEILVEDIGNFLHMIGDERIVPKNPVNATRISPQMAKVENNTTKTPINEPDTTRTKAEVEKLEIRNVEQEQPLCVSEARIEYCQTRGDIRVHGKSSCLHRVTQNKQLR